MENWKRVEDPREFHFIFMILYSYINLHIAIDGGILRYPPTEHVLLPSLHSLLIVYDHPQSYLWRCRITWHRTRHPRHQLYHIYHLNFLRTSIKTSNKNTVPFWSSLLHHQLLLRNSRILCRHPLAEIFYLLRWSFYCRTIRRTTLSLTRQVHSSLMCEK